MFKTILNDTKLALPVNATVAGTTVVNGTAIDTQGYDGVAFVCSLGALTATQVTSLKAQQGDLANGSDAVDIAGAATAAAADADSNKLLVVDVRRPTHRYVRPVVLRATANAVINSVIAILYRGAVAPSVQDAAVVSQSVAVSDS